jgi:hypothetical protein
MPTSDRLSLSLEDDIVVEGIPAFAWVFIHYYEILLDRFRWNRNQAVFFVSSTSDIIFKLDLPFE